MTRLRRPPRPSDAKHWANETSVLKPVPYLPDTEQDGPNVLLTNATVFDKKGGHMVNALLCKEDGVLTVCGNLHIDDPQARKKYLVTPIRGPKPIRIPHAENYSLGFDGSVWIRGESAWYELKPSPEYRPIYDVMYEGAILYHSLDSAHKIIEARKNRAKQTSNFDEIFFLAAVAIGDGSTLEDIKQRIQEHKRYLASHFEQNIGEWKGRPFMKWIQAEAKKPEPSEPTKSRSAGRGSLSAVSTPVVAIPSRPLRRSQGASSSPKPRAEAKGGARTRSLRSKSIGESEKDIPRPVPEKKVVAKPTPDRTPVSSPLPNAEPSLRAPRSVSDMSAGASLDDEGVPTIIEAFETLDSKVVQKGTTKKDSVSVNKLYFDYSWPSYKDSTPSSHRKPVTEILHYYAKALVKKLDKDRFGEQEIYRHLKDWSRKPWKPEVTKPEQYPFLLAPRKKKNGPNTDSRAPSTPKASSASASEAPFPHRSGKALSRKKGQKSVLRLAKRPYDEVDNDSDAPTPTMAKRSHYFSRDDEDDDDSSSSSPSESGGPEEPIPIILQAERIPSVAPRGPDDSWTCEEDGCSYIVRASDAAECRRKIEQHFSAHKEQASRMDLAVAESRGNMPINYLLEKIKALGAGKETNGNGIQPIKKKLIV